VHAAEALGPVSDLGEFSDREAGGVGDEDGLLGRVLDDFVVHVLLIAIFSGTTSTTTSASASESSRSTKASTRSSAASASSSPIRSFSASLPSDTLYELLFDVPQRHVVAGERGHLRDAVAHVSGAENRYTLDVFELHTKGVGTVMVERFHLPNEKRAVSLSTCVSQEKLTPVSGPNRSPMNERVAATLREDSTMARLIDRHGRLTIEPAADEFARLCTSIVNQQLSTASAAAIHERFVDVLGGAPTPDDVLAADEVALREAGLSGTKVEYLREAAAAFRDGDRDLTREGFGDASDEAVVAALTEIRGVGEWTARMYLIFALGREDVLPLGDLAVRKGIEQVYNDGAELTRAEMRNIGDAWRPYRSYGTRYVWAEYES